ncbi:helix-turn-helix domain-containing protein [Microbacterium maritypicum]|uniref:Helix-turn-helix domain-containing protein n=2 Tax=Microbacterium maritypicum TaxID=33918 RepID=A0ACD4B926_MICMQ|nr:helix-turn-helix transcriptional regulator [Microbacterium liquefaciens]UTT53766.1 helix-turn-helix domain-containing protein [Microbacterium liquefaciens]UTT53831.1 helix-turn-helix domain-containing protein [Microbacterium liquefaciens]
MPKMRKPAETFDEHVGDAVESAMLRARLTQADLATAAGMPLSNLGRSIRGTRPFTVKEFERLAGVMEVPASELLDSALANYGGMAKLLAEEGTKSEAPANVSPADEIPYIGHVTAPLTAAADDDARTGPKD